MNWKEHKRQLMKDPAFRKEYEALEPEYKLASDLIRLRISKGLTQEALAKILHTRQSAIARLESAGSLPSLSTVKRVAEALDADRQRLVLGFEGHEDLVLLVEDLDLGVGLVDLHDKGAFARRQLEDHAQDKQHRGPCQRSADQQPASPVCAGPRCNSATGDCRRADVRGRGHAV